MIKKDYAVSLMNVMDQHPSQFCVQLPYQNIRKQYPRFAELNDRLTLLIGAALPKDSDTFMFTTLSIGAIRRIEQAKTIVEVEFELEKLWYERKQLNILHLQRVDKMSKFLLGSYEEVHNHQLDKVLRIHSKEIIMEILEMH